MLPQASADFYRTQQRISAATLLLVRRQWATMGGDWDASWRRIEAAVLRAVVVGQVAAARQSESYLRGLLTEFGEPNVPVGAVDPLRFAGVNADGRPLSGLLDGAVINARKSGTLDAGGRWLDTVASTTLADTSRLSTATSMAARPNVVGYTRMLNPPSCSRCVVLAGAVYRWNDGFRRHPGCDCRHIPRTESMPDDPTVNPRSYFDSIDAATQDKTFGKAGAEAIREGADIGQVVNARRSGAMYTTDEGLSATFAGTGGQRLRAAGFRGAPRLMPETIFAQATNRTEAVELLRRHRFIV